METLQPREFSQKASFYGLTILALACCEGTSVPSPTQSEQANSTTTQAAPLNQKQRIIRAIKHLEYGRVEQVTEMLNAYLAISPKSKIARDLLKQNTTSVDDYIPKQHFTISLESGLSLSALSKARKCLQ